MPISETLQSELRFPHALGSVLALAVLAYFWSPGMEPVTAAAYVLFGVVAVLAAFKRVSREQLLPVFGVMCLLYGVYALAQSYATPGPAVVFVLLGVALLALYWRRST